MSISTDYHLHTNFSSDSDTPMEEMILSGIQKGLSTMCFTEHMDYDYPVKEDAPELNFLLNTEEYLQENRLLAKKYKDKCKILFGIELGLQPHLTEKMNTLLNTYPFDFVIGSIHLIDGQDPYYPEFFNGYGEKKAYERYFEHCVENLKAFPRIDSFGHLDYIVRYGPNQNKFYSYKEYADYIDETLKLLIHNGIAMEINTGSFKYGMNVTNPNLDIIKIYRQMGGELITIGSDAHVPSYIANQFHIVKDLLQTAGYQYYTIYEQRTPKFIKL